jgi:hypothetical protein
MEQGDNSLTRNDETIHKAKSPETLEQKKSY